MPAERKFFLSTLLRLAAVLAPLLVASLFWALYRYHTSSAAPAKGVTTAQSSASPSKSQQTAPIHELLSNAERAIMFSIAPLTSLSAIITPVDPDPIASFRQLIALPAGGAREAPRIDPRRIRTIVDRGVVDYASAKTDGDRARGAHLIYIAALVGYPPARNLLARNYPQSEAVRSVVSAKDVIRYALTPVMDVMATSEDLKQIFLVLGQHFAVQGSWIYSPPRSWVYCMATRARSSVIGLTLCWICWRACPEGVARSPAWYRAPARLPIKNARSANICASTSKRQGRPLRSRRRSQSAAVY